MHIILFGGSFDPPHNGHTTIADEVLEQKFADELWYVPCAQHPFLKSMGAAQDRLAMLKLTQSTQKYADKTKIFTYELEHPETSYSVYTLRHATQTFPTTTFSWLIGSDQLPSFHKWKEYRELLQQFQVFVYPRTGFPFEPLYEHMTPLTTVPTIDISSTKVRTAVAQHQPYAQWISPQVAKYIEQHGLYRGLVV